MHVMLQVDLCKVYASGFVVLEGFSRDLCKVYASGIFFLTLVAESIGLDFFFSSSWGGLTYLIYLFPVILVIQC